MAHLVCGDGMVGLLTAKQLLGDCGVIIGYARLQAVWSTTMQRLPHGKRAVRMVWKCITFPPARQRRTTPTAEKRSSFQTEACAWCTSWAQNHTTLTWTCSAMQSSARGLLCAYIDSLRFVGSVSMEEIDPHLLCLSSR